MLLPAQDVAVAISLQFNAAPLKVFFRHRTHIIAKQVVYECGLVVKAPAEQDVYSMPHGLLINGDTWRRSPGGDHWTACYVRTYV